MKLLTTSMRVLACVGEGPYNMLARRSKVNENLIYGYVRDLRLEGLVNVKLTKPVIISTTAKGALVQGCLISYIKSLREVGL